MRSTDKHDQLIEKWQLEQIEGRFPKSSVLLTLGILHPHKMLKGNTLRLANEKAAPILKNYMEKYRKRILRALYGCRYAGKLEAMAVPFFGVVEIADKHGSPCEAHIHFIIGLSKKQRMELFSKKKNGKLEIKSKALCKEVSKLNKWLEAELTDKGLDSYLRINSDYRRHNGANLDYLTKNLDKTIEYLVRYPEEQAKEKHTTTDGNVNLHFHNTPPEFTLYLKR